MFKSIEIYFDTNVPPMSQSFIIACSGKLGDKLANAPEIQIGVCAASFAATESNVTNRK